MTEKVFQKINYAAKVATILLPAIFSLVAYVYMTDKKANEIAHNRIETK